MDAILSHIITLISGIIIGTTASFFASRLNDKSKFKDSKKTDKKNLKKLINEMPDLIEEIKVDIQNPSNSSCREFFILTNKNSRINARGEHFVYYEDEHENLKSKFRIIEEFDFIYNITVNKTPKYQFREKFIDLIKEL